MIEHKIGDTFIFTDEYSQHHKLMTGEVYSGKSCEGCYLYHKDIDCFKFRYKCGPCHAGTRSDGRYVIFKEVKE